MTDENSGDQEVRQQCDTGQAVELALEHADWLKHTETVGGGHTIALAAEVRRLREERAELVAYGDGWKQQWEEMRDTMWKPAMDMLARVNALPAKWREGKRRVTGEPDAVMPWADELEAALRD